MQASGRHRSQEAGKRWFRDQAAIRPIHSSSSVLWLTTVTNPALSSKAARASRPRKPGDHGAASQMKGALLESGRRSRDHQPAAAPDGTEYENIDTSRTRSHLFPNGGQELRQRRAWPILQECPGLWLIEYVFRTS